MLESERQLIADLKSESKRDVAFGILVKEYQERLYWHIRKIVISHDDADDVLQDTFVKVWKNIENFREDSGLFTWVYRIATNESLNYISKLKRRTVVSISDENEYLVESLKSDEYFSGDEIQMKLQSAILKLPEKQRLVFNMKYFDDMKYKDMSDILETSVGALKASYHHAVKKIEAYMSEE
jgi:RNA polymerase sigma-70 factor (ECF subfamily)